MLRPGAILKLFVLALCLVPFTSSQRLMGALVPFRLLAQGPAGERSDAPENEEEDERESSESEGRHAPQSRHRPPSCEPVSGPLPVCMVHHIHLTKPRTAPPVTVDAFCNGLGAPYLC
ncbi:MAG TPA: hypothetical protein VGE74_31840 [Gemmata sp.]